MSVTFTEKWGAKSWKVSYDGPYENNREPHVEVGAANMDNYRAGDTFALANKHLHGKAVMYDVVGCQNGRHTAHFTVYFGDDAASKMSEL